MKRFKLDRSKYEPVQLTSTPREVVRVSPGATETLSPFMMCSLPALASSLDQFQRQFYGRQVPQTRIMQAKFDD